MKRILLILTAAFGFLTPAGAQDPSRPSDGFSVGVDVFGLTYNHYALYLEVPMGPSLSVTTAIAYSPAGGWQQGFEYWYLQSEVRSYQSRTHRQDLYTGFGLALYLSPNLLNFANWSPTPAGTSSSVFGAYGLVGYKYFPDPAEGFYIDPGFMVYALAPLDVQAPGARTEGTFFFKPAAPMMNLVAGWEL